MEFIKIEDLLRLAEEELKKINLHVTPIINIEEIDKKGIEARKEENSKGVFGDEQNEKVFFTQGLEGFLKLANRSIRLMMKSIQNRSNEKGQKGMRTLGMKQYYDEISSDFENIAKEDLEIKNISSDLKNKFFSIVKKVMESRTYYMLDLNGCTRKEYDKLNDKEKKRTDYLSDDYDEEYFQEDENGNKTIPDPEHLVTPNNMHTIKHHSVSVDKTHRIVDSNGNILNAFETIMKLCQKYKDMNPNKPIPFIMNKDGSGDNWLEEFYEQKRGEIIQSILWSIPPGRIKLNDGTEIYKREFIENFILSEEHIFSDNIDIEELVKSALDRNVNKYVIDDAYIDHVFDEMAENMITENKYADYQFFLEGLDGIDLRDKFDLDGLSPEMFRYLSFDSRTVFSDIQMEKFKPQELLEKGKSNEKTNIELNGKGTCVAILDKFSDISTEEFGGEVVKYIIRNGKNGVEVVLDEGEKTDDTKIYKGGQNDGSFHGNTVASLLAGKECGIVPNTKVILFEVAKDLDKKDEVEPKTAKEAMLKFINSNNDINPDIISISDSTKLTPEAKDAKDKLEEKGCAYIDSSVFWESFSWGRNNNGVKTLDPLLKKICEHPNSNKGKVATIKEAIMKSIILPYTQRTSTHISIGKDGKKEIVDKYNGSFCGASFVISQIAGLFLKARQVDKSISFDEFIGIARDTAKTYDNMKYLDAKGIIEKVKDKTHGDGDGSVEEHGNISVEEHRNSPVKEPENNSNDLTKKHSIDEFHDVAINDRSEDTNEVTRETTQGVKTENELEQGHKSVEVK